MPFLVESRCACLPVVPGCLLLFLALIASACSGAKQAPPKQPAAASEKDEADAEEEAIAMNEEAPCSAEARAGTYTIEFQTFSATCPAMESYDETWTGGAPPLDPSCKRDVPDKWSKDQCTFERAITCTQEDGGTTRTAYTSKQKHPTGSILTGMVSVRRYDNKGEPTCQGTYSFMATRQ